MQVLHCFLLKPLVKCVLMVILYFFSLAIYYCSALNSAHKDLVDMMKDQLVMEGKDKQFLLARIAELSGAPPKKKPPPYNGSQMKTINETKPALKNNTQTKADMNVEVNIVRLYLRSPGYNLSFETSLKSLSIFHCVHIQTITFFCF